MWIVYTLINIVSIGIFGFLFKTKAKDTNLSQAWLLFLGSGVTTILYALFGLSIGAFSQLGSVSVIGIYWLLGSILVNVLGLVSYLTAINRGELSIIGPLENLRPLFVTLFAFFIFKDVLTGIQIVGMLLVIFGAIFLNIKKAKDFSKIFSSPGVNLMIFSAVCYGFTSVADSFALRQTGFPVFMYAMFLTLGVTVVYGILAVSTSKGKKVTISPAAMRFVLIIGALAGLGTMGILTALSLQSAQLVIPLQMTRSLFVACLGFIFLKEKGYTRKLTAGFIMILGVFFILQ